MSRNLVLRTASAECPICGAWYDALEVEWDEDGAYVVLDTTPCRLCGIQLCALCGQFACDGCGHIFCDEHRQILDDLRLCPECARECDEATQPQVSSESDPDHGRLPTQEGGRLDVA